MVLIVWIVIPLAIALALGLVGYWSYNTYVGAWNQPVVKIGNETTGNVTVLDMRYFVKMLRYYSLVSTGNISSTSFPYQVLQWVEDDELVRQAAPGLGIQVTPDEVTEKINNDLISSAGGGGNTTGNITLPQTDLGKMYQQWLNYVRLSDSEYRHYVEATLLTQKLSDQITQSVPTEAKQVHVYAIVVDNQGNATEVENRLKNGEDFATLAAEYSTDNTTKQYGGDLGWLPQGILLPELDQAAFSLAAGNVSEPIVSTNGYYIIKVAEIDNNRPIDDQYRQMLASTAFTNWFTEQRNVVEIKDYYLTQAKATWAMNHIT
jgi:parvulin-like peptidyl-prolyl isomerase